MNTDTARCPGHTKTTPYGKATRSDCLLCERRLLAQQTAKDAAARISWITPPAEQPCPLRLEAVT